MRLRLFVLVGLVLLCFGILGVAQLGLAQDDTCPILVQEALEDMGDNCTGLDRNSACYGYNRVDATFAEDVLSDFFDTPSERAGLAQLETISTYPLDIQENLWGIAVMNVQANIPNALPGQAAVFMLMGDAEVENRVDPENVFLPADPVDVAVQSETRVFGLPQNNANVLVTLAAGDSATADGVSEDGEWLRVLTERGIGWIRIETVASDSGVAELPTLTGGQMSPMQAFHLSSSIDALRCSEAPSLLAIQSPEGLTMDLNANGVHIRMGSLIMIKNVPPGDMIQVFTIYGDVVLDPETENEQGVPPGFSTLRCLDEDFGDVGPDCTWSDPVPMTPEELEWAQTVLLAFQNVGLGGRTLQLGGQTVTLIDTDACPAGTVVDHVVNRGDTLFGLGLTYNTTVNSIAELNSLTTPTIYIGQVLRVVCGSQGPVDYPLFDVTPIVVDNPPPDNTYDCSPFRLTSPLDGIGYPSQTVYWDPAGGTVDGYRATISGPHGSSSATTGPDVSNVTLNTNSEVLGFDFDFTLTVEALVNGQPVCSSSVGLQREPPDDQPGDPDPDVTQEPPPSETEECVECGFSE